jgi:F0F1-type ATP synthase gamma subunit
VESINEIQNRLKGMEDIKHLLRSIRAMSAIRWRKAKQHLDIAQTYADNVDAQLGMVIANTGSGMQENFANLASRHTGENSRWADYADIGSWIMREFQHGIGFESNLRH